MKELEFEIEEHRWNRYIITIIDEEKFKEELAAWLAEHDSLHFSNLFDNFNYLEVSECYDVNEEDNERAKAEEIKNELYALFSNEMGIDVELLAYVAQSAKLGKQREDEGIENDQD